MKNMVSNVVKSSVAQNGLAIAKSMAWEYVKANGPHYVKNFVYDKFTTEITLPRGGDIGYSIMMWVARHKSKDLKKHGDYHSSFKKDETIWFRYMKTFFMMSITEDPFADARYNTSQITIRMLGRNQEIFSQWIDEIDNFSVSRAPVMDDDDDRFYSNVYLSQPHSGNFDYTGSILTRNFNSIILSAENKTKIISKLDRWAAMNDWYVSRGISHKLGILLTGNPGTGKTTTIRAIAKHLRYSNIYMVDLNHYDDSTLKEKISSIPEESVIVIEDFDSYDVVRARSNKLVNTLGKNRPKSKGRDEDKDGEDTRHLDYLNKEQKKNSVTMKGILEALDGILPQNKKVFVLTTNTVDGIDAALFRKSRVDLHLDLGLMDNIGVCEYIEMMFPNHGNDYSTIPFAPISGADIQDVFIDNMDDIGKFVEAIPKD